MKQKPVLPFLLGDESEIILNSFIWLLYFINALYHIAASRRDLPLASPTEGTSGSDGYPGACSAAIQEMRVAVASQITKVWSTAKLNCDVLRFFSAFTSSLA